MSGNPGGTANVNALKQGSGKNNNRFKKTHQKREVSRDLCGRCGTKDAKKNCPHLDRNVVDVEILTTINPFAAPSSLLP